MSLRTRRQGAAIVAKKGSLWAERYFDVEALTLHFKGQQTFTSTDFAFARKQSLVTALLYYKLSLHSLHLKSTLHQWRDRLFTNAKTVFWNIQFRDDSRSNASLGLNTPFIPRMQPFEACIIEISICVYSRLALTFLCNGSSVTMTSKFLWKLVDCCITYVTEQL